MIGKFQGGGGIFVDANVNYDTCSASVGINNVFQSPDVFFYGVI